MDDLEEVHQLIIAGFVEAVETVPVIQGFPVWSRTRQEPPVIGVVLSSSTPAITRRIGQVFADDVFWTAFVFARNEPEKLRIVGQIMRWLKTQPRVDSGGHTIDLRFVTSQRYEPKTGSATEAYGFEVVVQTSVNL